MGIAGVLWGESLIDLPPEWGGVSPAAPYRESESSWAATMGLIPIERQDEIRVESCSTAARDHSAYLPPLTSVYEEMPASICRLVPAEGNLAYSKPTSAIASIASA